jgi:hypothetical protein
MYCCIDCTAVPVVLITNCAAPPLGNVVATASAAAAFAGAFGVVAAFGVVDLDAADARGRAIGGRSSEVDVSAVVSGFTGLNGSCSGGSDPVEALAVAVPLRGTFDGASSGGRVSRLPDEVALLDVGNTSAS